MMAKIFFASGGGNNHTSAGDDGEDGNDSQSKPFSPILTFPLSPSTMESAVRSNADRLVELQGERRHEAHCKCWNSSRIGTPVVIMETIVEWRL